MLFSSAALESVRFYSLKVGLPLAPGGLIGAILGRLANTYLGFTGATLLLLLGFGIGLSLFTGISWLAVAERLGTAIEWGFDRLRRRMEERQDRELGAQAQVERELIVVEEAA